MASVKFCGLTRPEDAGFAENLGAAYVGVIFADESPRRITPARARLVLGLPRNGVQRVGVFGSASVDEIAAIADDTYLDVVQMHGRFGSDSVRELRTMFRGEIWAVAGVDHASGSIGRDVYDLADEADAILLDTAIGGVSGGRGRSFDWRAMSNDVHMLATRVPVVVAGGLTHETVGEAIGLLSPATVDVSSGVEASPGIKDHALMRAFAEAVRSAS